MSLQTLSYRRADLAAGLNPLVEVPSPPDPSVFPVQAGGGVDVEDAIWAFVDVVPREDPGRTTFRIEVSTVDLATGKYQVFASPEDYPSTPSFEYDVAVETPADLDALLTGWAAKLSGSSLDGSITAIADTENDRLVLKDATSPFGAMAQVVVAVSGGTGVVAVHHDAMVVDYFVMGRLKDSTSDDVRKAWRRLPLEGRPGARANDIPKTHRVDVRGFAELAVYAVPVSGQYFSNNGVPTYWTWIRPCRLSSSTP